MPLARNAIYESGAQILAAPTWDKSPNWLQSMQHIAREGGLFILSTCMALKIDDIPDENVFPEIRGLKGPFMCLNSARYGISWGTIGENEG